MQFSIATLVLALGTLAAASPLIEMRQNSGRPVPTGSCCVANTSVKQDTCTTAGGASGRCVPGGENCGGRLSCVADANLVCDNNVIERGKSLCRMSLGNGRIIDGANVITNLNQAKVN